MRISTAKIDRQLAGERGKLLSRGRSPPKPVTLMKSQIPIRTWADWDDAVPGFVEIDLVGHEGGKRTPTRRPSSCWSCSPRRSTPGFPVPPRWHG